MDIITAYNHCVTLCNDANVGYSQTYRNERTVNGITYYDCSSLMWYSLKAGAFNVEGAYKKALGYQSNNPFTTSNMCAVLKELGFVELSPNSEWIEGDILWRKGHTEMVYSGGSARGVTMGAHSAKYELSKQVSVNSYTSTASKWTKLFRFVGENTDVTPVTTVTPVTPNKRPLYFLTRRRFF